MKSSAHCAAPTFSLAAPWNLLLQFCLLVQVRLRPKPCPPLGHCAIGLASFAFYCMVPKCFLYFVHCVCKPKRSIDPHWCFLSSFNLCAIRGSVFSLLCVALHVRKSLGANRISHVKSLLLSFLSGSTPAEFSGKHARFHQGE